MIITELYNGQGFGNQLFVYVTLRSIAEKNGYSWGIQSPERFKGYDLMSIDMGNSVVGGSGPEGGPPIQLPNGIEHYYVEYSHGYKKAIQLGVDIRLTDKKILNIPDKTKIEGNLQSEDYFCGKLDSIKKWLKVKPHLEHFDTNGKNICVINFRGGDMIGNAGGFVPRSYWMKAIDNMLQYNPNMEFCIVTDDIKAANAMLPEYPAYHENIAWDYVALKNAKNVICSTSTFACFPLWTSETLEFCIAPKYWFDHNRSQGWWGLGYSIYSFPTYYMDREGKLFTPEECVIEWEEYKKTSNIYEGDL